MFANSRRFEQQLCCNKKYEKKALKLQLICNNTAVFIYLKICKILTSEILRNLEEQVNLCVIEKRDKKTMSNEEELRNRCV